jgi:threonine/homoserine/homoserine lactone efflux protein
MNESVALLSTLAAIYLAACISPGPNWILISTLAVRGERRAAVAVAAGIALGSTLWATLAILGAATFVRNEAVASALRLCGAAYLGWYGWSLARRPPAMGLANGEGAGRVANPAVHFRSGLLTSMTNPKAGMFWTSVFAANIPVQSYSWLCAEILVLVALMSSGFHMTIATVFGNRTLQHAYLRAGPLMQRAAGVFLLLAGIKLVLSP